MKKRLFLLIFLLVISVEIVYADGCDALLSYDNAMLINDILGMLRIGIPLLFVVFSWNDICIYRKSKEEELSNQAYKRILKKGIIAGAFFILAIILRIVISLDADLDGLNLVQNSTCRTEKLTLPD